MSIQSHIAVRRSQLSAAKRSLLEKRLRGTREGLAHEQVSSRCLEQGPPPLSFAQQRLWFLDQLEPGSAAYNILAAVRLVGPLNVTVLEPALNEIVRRHEVLRTTFALVEAQPVQVVAPTLSIPLSVVDLGGLSEADREIVVQRLAAEEAQRPFDLARGPLLRATLLRLGTEEYVGLLVMHHIVFDGWSHEVFMGELAVLYTAYAVGQPSPLAELPIQYGDFAVWQRQWLQGKVLETQLAYWKRQLGGSLPVLELPTDHPRPAVQTYRGALQHLQLSPTLTEELEALSRREGVTLFMTLLAAFKTLLSYYTGQEDIGVGTDMANRNQPVLERLIGFFINQLVLRTDLSGNPSFRDLLQRVREVCLGAYAHQDLPFEKLVEVLKPQRDLSRTPLFQVKIILHNAPMPVLDLPGVTFSLLEVDSVAAHFDLNLHLTETDQGLRGWLVYSTDLFEAATIARMLSHFEILLCTLVTQPEAQLATLKAKLAEVEKQQRITKAREQRAANLQKLKSVKRTTVSTASAHPEDTV